MRSPDIRQRIAIPDRSSAPDYSDIERACRRAGAIPQSDLANRTYAHDVVLGEVARQYAREGADADVAAVNADVTALTLYFAGAFDRKPSDGRPFDEVRQGRIDDAVKQVQKIHQHEGCTISEAIRRLLKRRGYGDREDLFRYLRNYMRR
jgi:hypothetical protein